MKPRDIVHRIETNPALPAGTGDRFAGYAVIGLPFRSGHVLALRRFPASSVGPGYTSVWHRNPRGDWTFYSTVNPDLGCSRYFGGEITHNVVAPIGIEWTGVVPSPQPRSLSTRLMNVKAMGAAARFALGTGKTFAA